MISLFKRKTKPLVNNTGFNFEDIKSMLSTSQTWGTDRKVFDIFIDNKSNRTQFEKMGFPFEFVFKRFFIIETVWTAPIDFQ